MFVRIDQLQPFTLVGLSMRTSFAENKIPSLWRSFMPRRNEIRDRADEHYYSVEVFDDLSFFQRFDPTKPFTKWAAVRVQDKGIAPENMQHMLVPAGSYAVFLHKGDQQQAAATYRYIFSEWLPASGYQLDDRPHFAVMGEKYRKDDASSEEEIFIPVRL